MLCFHCPILVVFLYYSQTYQYRSINVPSYFNVQKNINIFSFLSFAVDHFPQKNIPLFHVTEEGTTLDEFMRMKEKVDLVVMIFCNSCIFYFSFDISFLLDFYSWLHSFFLSSQLLLMVFFLFNLIIKDETLLKALEIGNTIMIIQKKYTQNGINSHSHNRIKLFI